VFLFCLELKVSAHLVVGDLEADAFSLDPSGYSGNDIRVEEDRLPSFLLQLLWPNFNSLSFFQDCHY
jgi:hypothetical protein